MMCANKVNGEIIFENNESGVKASFYEVLEYVAEGCETLLGIILCKDGVVYGTEEDLELLVRF